MDVTCAVAPTSIPLHTSPEAPSKFLIATKSQITIDSPSNSAFMTFSASDYTMDLPMMATEAELHAAPSGATAAPSGATEFPRSSNLQA